MLKSMKDDDQTNSDEVIQRATRVTVLVHVALITLLLLVVLFVVPKFAAIYKDF